MSKFGERLKELRTKKGLTQMELAEKVKINYSTLSDYERGDKKDPYISTIRTLANFFGVSIGYMSGDSDIEEDLSFEKLNKIFAQLDDDNKLKLISYAEFLKSEQRSEQK